MKDSEAMLPATTRPEPHEALRSLGEWLAGQRYRFTTVTPETHRRVIGRRAGGMAETLEDVLGWNLPFDAAMFPEALSAWLGAAGALDVLRDGGFRSTVRFATIDGIPYVHSSYPTTEADAVFCGPDTYRFVELIKHELDGRPPPVRVLDAGCGGGAGGLMASRLIARTTGQTPHVELVDINPRALALAKVNAALFGQPHAVLRRADLFQGAAPGIDLIVANPPYLLDDDARLYRHGGGQHGCGLSRRIVSEGLGLISSHGALVLYAGSAIVRGKDLFREWALDRIDPAGFTVSYREIDPDVFGEELDRAPYGDVERIAVIALVVRRSGHAQRETALA